MSRRFEALWRESRDGIRRLVLDWHEPPGRHCVRAARCGWCRARRGVQQFGDAVARTRRRAREGNVHPVGVGRDARAAGPSAAPGKPAPVDGCRRRRRHSRLVVCPVARGIRSATRVRPSPRLPRADLHGWRFARHRCGIRSRACTQGHENRTRSHAAGRWRHAVGGQALVHRQERPGRVSGGGVGGAARRHGHLSSDARRFKGTARRLRN